MSLNTLQPKASFASLLSIVLSISLWLVSGFGHAENSLLHPEQAFRFSVESSSERQAQLSWQIEPDYYLYQHKLEVKQGTQPLQLKLPAAVAQYDDNYGHSQVYYQQLQIQVPVQASKTYQVTWQGCAKDRICYPPQTIQFQTDVDGLVSMQNQMLSGQKRLLDLTSSNVSDSVQPQAGNLNPSPALAENPSIEETSSAQDQVWLQQLAQHSFTYGLLLFFGLGILLAFTPCSLPMLPILTSLLVREHKGLKAWMIALVFVLSMAAVYAVLGLIASSAGLNFQRWLQQPATLIAFSLLFVLFAANLFGLFEIKLPQAWVHRLDQAQSLQQGGTLLGASVMGVISALLVGPCMTAPLAGALLFIVQTQNQWQGALLLFVLGFGMGMPLLLASVLGSRVLPKAGLWMNQIKVIFAFIMLGLALYFIRPLLPAALLQVCSLLLGLGFTLYLVQRFRQHTGGLRAIYLLVLMLLMPYLAYSQYQQSQRYLLVHQQQNVWHVAQTAAEFEQLLAAAPSGQHVIIDVYADWCVACQPIEQRILKEPAVQQALQPFYLIKLDLSHYDASHQALLNQWQILGPPTYLFLNAEHQEQRALRLTGAFSREQLLQQLGKL